MHIHTEPHPKQWVLLGQEAHVNGAVLAQVRKHARVHPLPQAEQRVPGNRRLHQTSTGFGNLSKYAKPFEGHPETPSRDISIQQAACLSKLPEYSLSQSASLPVGLMMNFSKMFTRTSSRMELERSAKAFTSFSSRGFFQ